MSTQEHKARRGDFAAGVDAPAPVSAARVQFKRQLAGLSAAEQVEALKPPAPMVVQQKAAGGSGGAPVQFQGGGGEGSAPSMISDSGASVSTSGGSVEIVSGGPVSIAAPNIQLDSAMVSASGILSASTVQADTIVASAYTPGAGNLM